MVKWCYFWKIHDGKKLLTDVSEPVEKKKQTFWQASKTKLKLGYNTVLISCLHNADFVSQASVLMPATDYGTHDPVLHALTPTFFAVLRSICILSGACIPCRLRSMAISIWAWLSAHCNRNGELTCRKQACIKLKVTAFTQGSVYDFINLSFYTRLSYYH